MMERWADHSRPKKQGLKFAQDKLRRRTLHLCGYATRRCPAGTLHGAAEEFFCIDKIIFMRYKFINRLK